MPCATIGRQSSDRFDLRQAIAAAFLSQLIMLTPRMVNMSGRHCSPSLVSALSRPAGRSRQLVEQAERLVLADLHAPLKIAALCRALAISERNLRKAFCRIRGLPPHRCLQMLRLSRVRRALMSAGGQSLTVTEIATGLGFVELGRFSVEYRKMFGESPSGQAARERERGKNILNTCMAAASHPVQRASDG